MGDVGIPKGFDVSTPGMVALNWGVFGVLIFVITVSVVWLARLTAQAIGGSRDNGMQPEADAELGQLVDGSRWFLYGNVIVSHGIFGVLVIGVAWFSDIPVVAFSIGELSIDHLLTGVSVGVVLFGVSELVKYLLPSDSLVYSEHLRRLLAPTTRYEWVGLVGVVLPVVAVVEELLFRGALIGAFSYGYGVSPWVLAVVSSIVFGFGHGIQGRVGIVATGLLGGLLASVFIITNSLVVVIVAHFSVNLLEFVIHEYVSTVFSNL